MNLVKIGAGVLALGALALTPLDSGAAISSRPKILLHLKAVSAKAQCTIPAGLGGLCANADNTGDLNQPYHMMLIVDMGDSMESVVAGDPAHGIAGVQFGINYPGSFNPAGSGSMINVFSWTLCATLEFNVPPWPSSGGGNTVTWDYVNTCQQGRLSSVGYFYLTAYSAGTFQIIPRPVDNLAATADCDPSNIFAITNLSPGDLGSAHFSPGGGASSLACNPCLRNCVDDPVAIAPTTWSKVKNLLN